MLALLLFAAAAISTSPDPVQQGDAFMQKVRETADASYVARAEAAYRKALAADPKRVDALTGLAWVHGVRHEFEASIEWARKALAIDPQKPEAIGLIGDAAVEMGDYDLAYDQYQKMLDTRPDLSSYGRSAHLLFLMGDVRKASMLMEKAIGMGSPRAENTAWCRAQLALMMYAQGAYLPAEQVLSEGLGARPNDYRLLAAMGRVKASEKDYNAAITFYKRAIAIVPQQDVVAALGDVYKVSNRETEAQMQYALVKAIAQINKANGITGDMLTARFYADHDRDLPEALRLAEDEYKTRKNVYAADTLAWCLYKSGRAEEAKQYIQAAMQHGTPEAAFAYHKGLIYSRLGARRVAAQALYEAVSLNTNFDPVQAPVALRAIEALGGGAQSEVASSKLQAQ